MERYQRKLSFIFSHPSHQNIDMLFLRITFLGGLSKRSSRHITSEDQLLKNRCAQSPRERKISRWNKEECLLQIEWHEFTLITNSLFAFKQCIMFNSCFSGSFFLMNFCFDLYPSKVWNACIPVISTTPWLSIHKKSCATLFVFPITSLSSRSPVTITMTVDDVSPPVDYPTPICWWDKIHNCH